MENSPLENGQGNGSVVDKIKSVQISRRSLFKFAGLAGGVAALGGIAASSFGDAKSIDTMMGWESEQGEVYFNREPFRVDKPGYEIKGPVNRVDQDVDSPTFRRLYYQEDALLSKKGEENLMPRLKEYYAKHPDKLEGDRAWFTKLLPNLAEEEKKMNKDMWGIATAWNKAWTSMLAPLVGDPKEWDFKGVIKEPLKVKDPKETSKLIKKMAGLFGGTLVGITKVNPRWILGWGGGVDPRMLPILAAVGIDPITPRGVRGGPIDIPDWWQYAIVIAVPHEPNLIEATPLFYSPFEAYTRSGLAAARLTGFIKALGYPARYNGNPIIGWDELLATPLAIDAGLGEMGRPGILVTPEFGPSVKLAVVLTNLPMEPDRPINMGLKDFCDKCGICAEKCPGGSIPSGQPELQDDGVVRWMSDREKCQNYYASVPIRHMCGVCYSVCPWRRFDNALHKYSRELAVRDRTGIAHQIMLWGQKSFYPSPSKDDYNAPTWATYKDVPWWMRTDMFFDGIPEGIFKK
ncbi:MAG: 4Fe-4S dicluster domain-containing protein [Dehalobacter sp. 4CP]|uniref:dehalogenase n=1 Tax=Dehalobacter sp. CP TaxID=2594474 RepID=UPI0013CBCC40|nr:4Fe-4S dicluster domain-containing protein [Dehalobacter sp. 4CP]